MIEIEHDEFVPMNHQEKEFFPVELTELYDEEHAVIPGWQLVRRADTHQTLHVHTDSYKLVPFEDNVQSFETALHQSGLDLTDMRVDSDMSHNGCRHFRQYVLPSYRESIRGNDDISLRFLMWDSYDGSTRWITRGGFYQWVCANLAVTGEDILNIRRKHTQNFDNSVDYSKITETVAEYTNQVELYRKYAGLTITDKQASEFFGHVSPTRKLAEHLTRQWVHQVADWDRTLWDVYSVLTSYSTHGETGTDSKNQAHTIATRQDFVKKIVESKAFNQLELEAA